MKKMVLIFCLSISTIAFGQTSSLVIGGVLDLGLSGNAGKAYEFVAIDDITDLSAYAVGIANNGGGTDGIEANFPAVALTEGESFWLIYDSTAFQNYFGNVFGEYNVNFGFDASLNANGDDAIELFLITANDTTLVDLYGDLNTDGTGEVWEYMDAWAYKDPAGSVTFDGSAFSIFTRKSNQAACPVIGSEFVKRYPSPFGGKSSCIK